MYLQSRRNIFDHSCQAFLEKFLLNFQGAFVNLMTLRVARACLFFPFSSQYYKLTIHTQARYNKSKQPIAQQGAQI